MKPGTLADALRTLLNPLESANRETWRTLVCERLRRMTETDVVFFRLSDDGPTTIDPAGPLPARDAYRAEFRDLDPWPRAGSRAGETMVATLEELIGGGRLPLDQYYNEFAIPYGLRDYVGIQTGTAAGEHAHLGIFNSGRSVGADKVAEMRRRIRTIVPALEAGLRAWLMTDDTSADLGGALDRIRDAVALYDGRGRLLHANVALEQLTARDPSASVLRQALQAAARDLARSYATPDAAAGMPFAPVETTTLLGTYRISAVRAGSRLTRSGGVLLLLDPPRRTAAPAEAIVSRLGLDPAEAKLATLVATGHSNEEIARRIGISPSAARRRTTLVLRKSGVRSRGQLHARLFP